MEIECATDVAQEITYHLTAHLSHIVFTARRKQTILALDTTMSWQTREETQHEEARPT